MMQQLTAEVAVIGVNRTDKGCFVRLEIHSPDELEPFFQAKGGQYIAVFQRIHESEEQTKREARPQRLSVLAYKVCRAPAFWAWAGVKNEDHAVKALKFHLQIDKRAELDNLENLQSRKLFAQILKQNNGFGVAE